MSEVHNTSSNEQGPLWTPTAQVERMMRDVKDSGQGTIEIDRKVLEGLLYDSLLWRKERAERSTSAIETPSHID